MDFGRLKELVRKLGGVLVLDGEEPEFVILSYGQYEKLEAGEEVRFSRGYKPQNVTAETNGIASAVVDRDVIDDEQAAVERLNQEILALKEEIRLKEEAELQSGELVESVENEQSAEPAAELVDLD